MTATQSVHQIRIAFCLLLTIEIPFFGRGPFKKKAWRYFYEKKTPAQEENQSVIIFRAHASHLIKNRRRTMWPG